VCKYTPEIEADIGSVVAEIYLFLNILVILAFTFIHLKEGYMSGVVE
jgi:hypothetical protein